MVKYIKIPFKFSHFYSVFYCHPQGETKLLVTGPWHANQGSYSVLMDGKVMATTLVQPGVLRCLVPGELQ